MIFQILKTGAEPNKRFLQLTMLGDSWTSQFFSHRFFSIEEAKTHLDRFEAQGLAVHMIWVDTSEEKPMGVWGEVNLPAWLSSKKLQKT